MMGATNTARVVSIVMPLLFTLGALLLVMPWLVHGLDSGHVEVEAGAGSDAVRHIAVAVSVARRSP